MSRKMQRPQIGCAFDPDQRNPRGIVESYIDELNWYRPRGFAKLRNEGAAMLRKPDEHSDWQNWCDWSDDCDSLLSDHAQRYDMPNVSYGPFEHGGAIGYYVHIEGAKEDSDLVVNDTSEVPRGFSGYVLHVNDHGNVTAYRYSRGKSRELWAVV